MKLRIALLSLVVAAGSFACKAESTPPTNTPTEDLFDDHWTPTSPTDKGPTTLNPVAERNGKRSLRLTVDHLRRSIPVLFNGVTWEGRVRGRTVNMFDALSRTLGEADYIEVTEPNTQPSPLFAKFMDDMAGHVCQRAVQADMTANGDERAVVMYANDAQRNLRFMRLKFHGIHVPDGTTEGIADYEQLYNDILADTNEASQAWQGVCIAMLTAPEFMSY